MRAAVAAMWVAVGCQDYDLTTHGGVGQPIDEVEPADTDPPGETGDASADPPHDFTSCVDGFWADYYNLPADHPDIEGDVTGIVQGDDPWAHDWYDASWWSRREVDPGLEFGTGWFPLNEGLAGDPYYFAVHWHAWVQVDGDGTYAFELGSDDDSWAVFDGAIHADLGGIHGVEATSFEVPLTAGVHALDLYMAERHTTDSGFWFRFLSPGVSIWACP